MRPSTKKLDDDIKQTVIRGIGQDHLRKRLEKNLNKFMDSDELLEEITGFIEVQKTDNAMDIGWLGKGKGNWWDKGKGGKGLGGKDGKVKASGGGTGKDGKDTKGGTN